ncbi:hypothetical protein SDC9_191794 [bioreactor metagenome]|uniref:Uncharacterized protein n=1 Tax=bioreactor metagenome TaxID=1076179 RepID=A0A645I9Y6_9ZZZZ
MRLRGRHLSRRHRIIHHVEGQHTVIGAQHGSGSVREDAIGHPIGCVSHPLQGQLGERPGRFDVVEPARRSLGDDPDVAARRDHHGHRVVRAVRIVQRPLGEGRGCAVVHRIETVDGDR